MYWANTKGVDINTAVLFFELAINEMVKIKFNP